MRLIDADEFIEYLGLDEEKAGEVNVGQIVTLEDFFRQETAYDVDNVFRQLKNLKNQYIKRTEELKRKPGITTGSRGII